MSHPIVHVEIPAGDAKAAGTFYADLFGWRIQTEPNFDYVMFEAQGGPGGGFTSLDAHTEPGDVVIYVQTDDIEATLAKATTLGGQVMQTKMEVPGMGWLAVFTDPTGNRIGLWKPMNPA